MRKNTFLVLKIAQFLFLSFGHVGKLLDHKAKVNFKNYDIKNNKQLQYTHFQRSPEVKAIR